MSKSCVCLSCLLNVTLTLTILSFDSSGLMVPTPLQGYPLYLMYLNTMKKRFFANMTQSHVISGCRVAPHYIVCPWRRSRDQVLNVSTILLNLFHHIEFVSLHPTINTMIRTTISSARTSGLSRGVAVSGRKLHSTPIARKTVTEKVSEVADTVSLTCYLFVNSLANVKIGQ
jgi:hypothetical protein